jgi:hypothetical protein
MFHHHGLGLPWLIAAAVIVVPFWRICARVGHSPWLSLLLLVPLVNVIFVYYLAFGQWPLERGAPPASTSTPPV